MVYYETYCGYRSLGSCAAGACESCQVRKEAALSGKSRVPQGCLGFRYSQYIKKLWLVARAFLYAIKLRKLCCLLLGNQEDKDQGADQQHKRIGQVGDDLKGADGEAQLSGSGDSYQHLSTVRDDALEDTGESI